jgi:leucyl aminopeptidase
MFSSLSIAPSADQPVVVVAQTKTSVGPVPISVQNAGWLKRWEKSGAALLAATNAGQRAEATGEVGIISEAFTGAARVLVVGVGEEGKLTLESLRLIAAAIARKLAAIKATGVHIDLTGPITSAKLNPQQAGTAIGEAFGLLAWVCDEFRGKPAIDANAKKRVGLAVSIAGASVAKGFTRGLALAESANLCRTLSQTPPNIATPQYMAQQAQKLAKQCKLSCKVIQGDELVKEKCEGLINVGKASENLPCLIRLEYTPQGGVKKGAKPVVLIGKTMTYDSGGLSLKINNGMVGMKRDKDGGCAVLGAMHAIATTILPKQRVIAYLAVAENSISDEAYRPDDVLTFRNGVTVEITNTDAEGRLVLADALCIACEKDDPSAIIDLATLTGGVVTALGSTFCGMFCEDDALRGKIEAAATKSGERVWRLPMHTEYREMMKSPIADILNSNPNRKAHPIQGAAFLSYFVKEGVPWCHLDIAGVHATEKNAGMFIEGPTGWGTRLLAELLA